MPPKLPLRGPYTLKKEGGGGNELILEPQDNKIQRTPSQIFYIIQKSELNNQLKYPNRETNLPLTNLKKKNLKKKRAFGGGV